MTQDPFEEEARRRAEEIDRTDADRLEAIAKDEEAQYAGKPRAPFRVKVDGTSMKVLREDGGWEEIPQAKPLPPRIGSWEPGNSQQDLQSMRFEIEAERALQLGKSVSVSAHDEELKQLHLKLNQAHVAYQRSGDPSLLIGIADLKAQYEKRQQEVADQAKKPRPEQVDRVSKQTNLQPKEAEHLVGCVTTSHDYMGLKCSTHGWPMCQKEWERHVEERRKKDRRSEAEEHLDTCVVHTHPETYGECNDHGWPVNWQEWEYYADKEWSSTPQKAELTREEKRHHERCLEWLSPPSSRCSLHGWPTYHSQWMAELEKRGKR